MLKRELKTLLQDSLKLSTKKGYLEARESLSPDMISAYLQAKGLSVSEGESHDPSMSVWTNDSDTVRITSWNQDLGATIAQCAVAFEASEVIILLELQHFEDIPEVFEVLEG